MWHQTENDHCQQTALHGNRKFANTLYIVFHLHILILQVLWMESPFQMNNSFILKKVASGYCVKKIMKPFICWWLGTLIYNELCMLTAQSNTENCKIQCSIICWGPGLNCRCLWYPSLVLIQKGCVW